MNERDTIRWLSWPNVPAAPLAHRFGFAEPDLDCPPSFGDFAKAVSLAGSVNDLPQNSRCSPCPTCPLLFASDILFMRPHRRFIAARSTLRCRDLDIYLDTLQLPERDPCHILYSKEVVGAWAQIAPLRVSLAWGSGLDAVDGRLTNLRNWYRLSSMAIRAWLYYHLHTTGYPMRQWLSSTLTARFAWSSLHVLNREGGWAAWPPMSRKDAKRLLAYYVAASNDALDIQR